MNLLFIKFSPFPTYIFLLRLNNFVKTCHLNSLKYFRISEIETRFYKQIKLTYA
jgi:hypothetical protein